MKKHLLSIMFLISCAGITAVSNVKVSSQDDAARAETFRLEMRKAFGQTNDADVPRGDISLPGDAFLLRDEPNVLDRYRSDLKPGPGEVINIKAVKDENTGVVRGVEEILPKYKKLKKKVSSSMG